MIPAVRREKIKNMILTEKNVSVINLSQVLSVSEETIRRDLKYLEEEGILTRTHGGAMLANRVTSTVNTKVLENIFVANKKQIALQCKQFIKNNDCIYLDSSTTAYHIAKEILDLKLTVVTNSLNIITLLSDYENINVICTGGSLSIARKCFGGRSAIRFLNQYYVDKAFISCRSLSISEGITDSNDDEAAIKETIVNRANLVYVVADYSKFDKVSFAHICNFDSINGIITDKPVSNEWIQLALDHDFSIWDSTQNSTLTDKEQL